MGRNLPIFFIFTALKYKSILFFDISFFKKNVKTAYLKAFYLFLLNLLISFFYTIFCGGVLDFTTRYGIIVRHDYERYHNILCLKIKNLHKIL